MAKLTAKQFLDPEVTGKFPALVTAQVSRIMQDRRLKFMSLIEKDTISCDEGERLTFYGKDANGDWIVKSIQAPTNEGGHYNRDISYYLLSRTISMKQYGIEIVVSERLFMGKWYCTVQVQEGVL